MCSLIGSFSKHKLQDLYKLNSYRGELSYSLASFNHKNNTMLEMLYQDEGKMKEDFIMSISTTKGSYFVAHSQAPTTDTKNIHPATYGNAMLWHNGIIKQKNITEGTWDTAWLLEQIVNYGWSSLSNVDGTFACIMYYGSELFIFRNEISPLFIDSDLNISSTKFDECEYIKPNVVHKLNLEHKIYEPVAYFETKENPYYIPGLA